jgi:hypothetical protein
MAKTFFLTGVSPSLIPFDALHEVATVKAAILEKYGFEPTDRYCRDLIVFIDTLIGADSLFNA